MTKDCSASKHIIVVGAGAAGMMAAGRAAEMGASVLLLEKMEHPGKKLLISGKTRCNLSNTRDFDSFIAMYGSNGRFLYSAFNRFFRDELLAFLKNYGVRTNIEKDGRIFPVSNDAGDVVEALKAYLSDYRVQICTNVKVNRLIVVEESIKGVETEHGMFPATAVIVATGGASYPATGSTGDGYRMAGAVGHTMVKLRPSLVPLVVQETRLARTMQGISLKQVRLTAYHCRADDIPLSLYPASDCGRGIGRGHAPYPVIESRRGDMMITHSGIGGPITLQMSLSVVDALEQGPVSVAIDLVPDRAEDELHQMLQLKFDSHGRRSCRRILAELLPQRMVIPFLEIAKISPEKLASQVNVSERKIVASLLKSFRFNIKRPSLLSTAMVTAGGVALNEIEPRTMASRLVRGLYFCGEVMDIDADTGGYNLTAAFSTGYSAGEHAAAFCTDSGES